MQFGLLSTNSGEGLYRTAAASWQEDLWEMLVAERLGFMEVWVAEHVGPKRPTSMRTADLFICKAAALTTRMRFGPAVRPLPLYHPLQVAMEAAACDHLTGGRYMAGFGGAGGEAPDQYRQRGLGRSPSESRAVMHEAIDLILKCWTEPQPFDYEGQFWQGQGINVIPKPLQQPFMPVGLAVTESPSTAQLAGRHGFLPLTQYHNGPTSFRPLAEAFVEAAGSAGRAPSRSAIRVCRYVHVSDSDGKAKDEVRGHVAPMLDRHKREQPWHYSRCLPPNGATEDLTFDYLADSGVYFVGNPETVYRRILDEYNAIGGFGTLLLVAGRPIGSRRQRLRSWRLFMEHVAPRLRDLDPDSVTQATAL